MVETYPIPADQFTGKPHLLSDRQSRIMGSGRLGFYVQSGDNVYRAPDGTRELFVQNRVCGDWYAELLSDRCHVARIGLDQEAALVAVIAAVGAS